MYEASLRPSLVPTILPSCVLQENAIKTPKSSNSVPDTTDQLLCKLLIRHILEIELTEQDEP